MSLAGLPVLTAAETRAAEQAIFDRGVSPYALMEQAGSGAAEWIWRIGHKQPLLVLCGPGNNGGDGFVIARLLRERGVPVRVAATGESGTDSSRKARAAWDGPVEDVMTADPETQVVDALFGIGLARGLDAALSGRLDSLVRAASHSYAIDLPSGVDSDTGALLSAVPAFDMTIAPGVLKPAHVLLPSAALCGAVVSAPIGIDTPEAAVRVLETPCFAAPPPDAHKYRRGLVAVVAGPMAGASALAAEAAARGGAGYVRIVGAQAIVDLPHAVVRASARDGGALTDERIAAIVVGPGLGRGDAASARLSGILATDHPAVVDADGLLALKTLGFSALPEKAILTPHAGEFAALFGEMPGSCIDRARAAAAISRGVVILKGHDTVIAAPDGRVRIACGATTWLSTAGTGDVLAGLCGAQLAVTGDPFRAACAAVWLHGDAARRAGPAFIADDLPRHVPAALASRMP